MTIPSLKPVSALCSLPLLFSLASAHAQTAAMIARPTPPAATAPTAVPNLVPFAGVAQSREGKPLTGDLAATFLIFKDEQGGEPLWVETQSVTIDPTGRYQVQLGASSTAGLPASTFSTGEGRWLEVQISGQEPQPRIFLSSVPYAMKASDAETLGGLSARNFVTQSQLASAAKSLAAQAVAQITPDVTLTGTGVTNYVPLWTSASNLGDSVIYQSTTKVGINTTAPTASLHVVGPTNGAIGMVLQSGAGYGSLRVGGDVNASTVTSSVRKIARFSMPDWAADTQGVLLFSGDITSATTNDMYFGGATGSPLYGPTTLHFFTSPTSTTVGGTEKMTITSNGNVGISAQNPAAKLEVNGTAKFDGLITFASGQTFPGGGGGTITQVKAGTGLTGGGTSGAVTLNVDTTKVPLLAASNTFTGTQTITGNELMNGNIGFGTTAPDGNIDIESTNSGQPLLISAEVNGAWAINSFGGPNGGLAGRFVGGNGSSNHLAGSGISAGGGSTSDSGDGGVGGYFFGGYSSQGSGGDGISSQAGNYNDGSEGWAGIFTGDVDITGTLFAGAKDFRIDHPLDPANKYLNHVSIESSEMMNLYSGNVTTDAAGISTIALPDWFETLNTDFRYQLTVVGQFAQAIIKTKIANGKFTIATNAPNVEVSWQVTAVRQDAYAKAHPITVEQNKPANERGFYLHPELYGQPKEKQTEWGRHPELMRQMKDSRAQRRLAPSGSSSQPAAK